MVADKPRRRRRRRRASPTSPTTLSCQVPGWREGPPRSRALRGPARALVRLLPAYKSGPEGRPFAIAIKVAIGAGAVALAGLGTEHFAFALLAAVVALTTLVLPLPDYRKARWLARAEALGEPRRIPAPTPGELTYDGAKLTIRADDRVWKSLRPRHLPHDVVVGVDSDRALLGLVKPRGKRSDALWFAAPLSDLGDTYDPVETDHRFDPDAVDDPVTLSGPDWAALHEQLWDPTTGGLPRPRGPAHS